MHVFFVCLFTFASVFIEFLYVIEVEELIAKLISLNSQLTCMYVPANFMYVPTNCMYAGVFELFYHEVSVFGVLFKYL